jgi:hypothetical protein
MRDGCASSARRCTDIPARHSTFFLPSREECSMFVLGLRRSKGTRLPGSDKAVQPSAAVGDVPSRVRRLVRWKKVVGKAHRGPFEPRRSYRRDRGKRTSDGKRVGPQMAPQRPEKIHCAPGDGMAPDARDLQDRVPARGEALYPTGPAAGAVGRKLRHARKWRRKDMKNIGFATGNGMAPRSSNPRDLASWRGGAFHPNGRWRDPRRGRFWRLTH